MPIYLPVNPEMDDKKRIRALASMPMFGDAAMPYPESAPTVTDATGTTPITNYYQTTIQAAGSLGVGDMFKIGAEGYYEAMIMDTTVGVTKFRTGQIPSSVKILGTTWGLSVRVAMKIRTLKTTANANLSFLAAQVEFGAAEIQYSVQAIGIDREVFAAALRGVPLFGKLDYTAYARLSSALDELKVMLAKRITSQPLLPIGVFVRDDPFDKDIIAEGRSVRWTMVKLANKIKFSDAVATAPAWLNQTTVERVYRELNGQELSMPVEDKAANHARDWLRAG